MMWHQPNLDGAYKLGTAFRDPTTASKRSEGLHCIFRFSCFDMSVMSDGFSLELFMTRLFVGFALLRRTPSRFSFSVFRALCSCVPLSPSGLPFPFSVLVSWQFHENRLHYITLHYTTLHYTTLHYTTLHYTTLHYTTLHYTTLHYTTRHTYIHTSQHMFVTFGLIGAAELLPGPGSTEQRRNEENDGKR